MLKIPGDNEDKQSPALKEPRAWRKHDPVNKVSSRGKEEGKQGSEGNKQQLQRLLAQGQLLTPSGVGSLLGRAS